jgi:hypothetical protein
VKKANHIWRRAEPTNSNGQYHENIEEIDTMKKLLVTLTPAESKRLIARGLLATDTVKEALKNGYLCVTLGTTSSYLVEEILGEYDKTRHIAGVVLPQGLSVTEAESRASDAIFHKGKYLKGKKIIDVLEELGSDDVIIKSANALDTHSTRSPSKSNRRNSWFLPRHGGFKEYHDNHADRSREEHPRFL